MKNFKVSKYNYFFQIGSRKNLAFNAISGGFAKIRDKERVMKFIENPNNSIENERDKEVFENLLRGGFIIDSNINETSILKIRFWNERFNSKNLGITLAPTLNCNFKCIYCYERDKNVNKHINMSKGKANTFIKFIYKQIDNGVKNIGISWYGGEPLLEIKAINEISTKIIEVCDKNKISYSSSMISNGYLLNEKAFETILKSRIKFIQITLDGPPDIHNHFRPLQDGSPTFSIIIKNIKKFIDFTKGKVKIAIRINLAQENMESSFNLIKILEKEGLKNKVSIYPGQIITDNSQMTCLLDNKFSDIEIKFMERILRKGWKIHLPPLPKSTYCSAFIKNSYVIGPNLNLYKCWESIGVDKLKIGSINNDGEIKFRESYINWLSFDPFEIKECKNCKFLPLCMGGCISKTIEEKQIYNKLKHGKCPSLKNNLLNKLEIYYKYTTKDIAKEGK
jgi:uncharacterized protein